MQRHGWSYKSILLNEISHSKKDTYHMISFIVRFKKENKKNGIKRARGKPRNRLSTIENKLVVRDGRLGEIGDGAEGE